MKQKNPEYYIIFINNSLQMYPTYTTKELQKWNRKNY